MIPEATAWFTGEALMEDEDDEVRCCPVLAVGLLAAVRLLCPSQQRGHGEG